MVAPLCGPSAREAAAAVIAKGERGIGTGHISDGFLPAVACIARGSFRWRSGVVGVFLHLVPS
jgi:hypothetical protein